MEVFEKLLELLEGICPVCYNEVIEYYTYENETNMCRVKCCGCETEGIGFHFRRAYIHFLLNSGL